MILTSAWGQPRTHNASGHVRPRSSRSGERKSCLQRKCISGDKLQRFIDNTSKICYLQNGQDFDQQR